MFVPYIKEDILQRRAVVSSATLVFRLMKMKSLSRKHLIRIWVLIAVGEILSFDQLLPLVRCISYLLTNSCPTSRILARLR